MGCCAQELGARRANGSQTRAPAEILKSADARPPARIAFKGGRSPVGTDHPEIPQDGEGPRRWVRLSPFEVEAMPVTNARFAAFVAATGYVTAAERFGWAPVFRPFLSDPAAVPSSNTTTPWWGKGDGAAWYAPEGPGSHVLDRADHPVVQVSWADAAAFAAWSGGRLPSEAEWEHAARGGRLDPRFPWGDQEPDDEAFLPCNIWQGRFPVENTRADGWMGTSPVGSFAPNGAGLYDMAGNVWEWTADRFQIHSLARVAKARNREAKSLNEKIMKGGSFLCQRSYCYRYRIVARSAVAADSGASNTGFRVFYDAR